MKSIRLLSFQNAHNFGAVLQAYGLQQTIKSMGYEDVKFINYNPEYLRDRYNPFHKKHLIPSRTLWGTAFKYLNYPFFLVSCLKRNKKFRRFIDTMIDQTKIEIVNEEGLRNIEADVLICGSDQIWNTALTGDFDAVFLGQGPYKKVGHIASYAPSTELSSLTEEKAEKLSKLLDGFKYISVREAPVKDKLQKYIDKEINVCVDPTILCGANAFNRIATPRIVKKEYIVVYAYNPKDIIVQDLVKSIPDYQNYDIHYVLLGEKGLLSFYKNKYHSAISVQDFLSYIKHAKYVVTNSFHGLAFSLIFEKNFYVAYCKGLEVRCLSLLQQIGLEERMVQQTAGIKWPEPDYETLNKRIDSLRKDSLEYLIKVLEDSGDEV